MDPAEGLPASRKGSAPARGRNSGAVSTRTRSPLRAPPRWRKGFLCQGGRGRGVCTAVNIQPALVMDDFFITVLSDTLIKHHPL